jgi:hypothetical protein
MKEKLKFIHMMEHAVITLVLIICLTILLTVLAKELVNGESNEAMTALMGVGMAALGQALQRIIGALASNDHMNDKD